MPAQPWKLSAESITAAAAVVTALIALGIGVWENIQQRRHPRLSVFPSLEYVIELRTSERDSIPWLEISVFNDGVGPAIVRGSRIRVHHAGGSSHPYRTWGEAVAALEGEGVRIGNRAEFGEGLVSGAGASECGRRCFPRRAARRIRCGS